MQARSHRSAEAVWTFVAVGVLVGVPLLFADWDFLRSLDFSAIWTYRSTLLLGLLSTAVYAIGGIVAGYPLGILLAICGRSRFAIVRGLVVGYVEIWRNTPLLVQLFWIHFALPVITGISMPVSVSGFIAFTANVSAYYSEIARAGINSIAAGQWDAARSLGLRPIMVWRLIVLPQALRIVIPPSTNLSLSIFKATSILSIIGIGELMRETTRLSNFTFRVVEFYTVTALIFVALGLAIAALSRRLERRFEGGQPDGL